MHAELDVVDRTAAVGRRILAIQIDHRPVDDIEREPTVAALFALARALLAWTCTLPDGRAVDGVAYEVTAPPSPLVLEALTCAGAVLVRRGERPGAPLGPRAPGAISELAERLLGALAREAIARIGVRDPAVALRMLEDQTTAAPPPKADAPHAYWRRVLELSALTGELLRARFPAGRWVATERAVVPFGFEIPGPEGTTVLLPTNRAQRVVEGAGESLLLLLPAAAEALAQPGDERGGPLMPSLRDRATLDLDEIAWVPLFEGPGADHPEVPVIVLGIDGETTFGVLHRAGFERPVAEALAEALARLPAVIPTIEEIHADDLVLLAATGSYFAAEKLLDRGFLRGLHAELAAPVLAVAVPARGLLVVTAAHDAASLARFSRLARLRFEDSGPRALSPAVLLVEDGAITDAFTSGSGVAGTIDAETSPASPARATFWRRLFRRTS